MPNFKISGLMTVSVWTEVEAETEAEALAIARSRAVADYNIDASCEVTECFLFDTDGMPTELRINEE